MAEALILVTWGRDRKVDRRTVQTADEAEGLARDYIRSHPSAATVIGDTIDFGHAGATINLFRATADGVTCIRSWSCYPHGWWGKDVRPMPPSMDLGPRRPDRGERPSKIHEPAPC